MATDDDRRPAHAPATLSTRNVGQGAVAELSRNGETVVIRKGNWRARIPVEDLNRWLAFYRRLRDRRGGAYAKHYQLDIDALEKVRREIRSRSAG